MTPRVDSPAEPDQFVIVRKRTAAASRYLVGRVVEITRDDAVRAYARCDGGRPRQHTMNWEGTSCGPRPNPGSRPWPPSRTIATPGGTTWNPCAGPCAGDKSELTP